MRTFAPKRHQPQGRVAFGIQHWRRMIDQPAQIPPQRAKPDASEARSDLNHLTHFDLDPSQISIHPKSVANFQAKPTASSPGDAYEQEADRVSEQVMRMPEPRPRRDGASGAGQAKFQTAQPSPENVRVHTKRVTASELAQTEAPSIVHQVLRSPGQSLNSATRAFMASRFGYDFIHVRVHTGGEAADAARAVRARAYTIGGDIVFGAGEYAPTTPGGKRLLAHELTHVMQQQVSGGPHILSRTPDDSKRESEDKKESKESKKEEDKEDKERQKLLAEFTERTGLSSDQLAQIKAAMRAFSLHQLRIMRDSGLRFSPGDSLPPELQGRAKIGNLQKPAEYSDVLRVIRISDRATTDAIRHEMAHSWDHARTGKLKRISQLKDKEMIEAESRTPPFSSETSEKRATKETVGGKVRDVSMPISEMFDRYKKASPLHSQAFDNPSTSVIHSKVSPTEFYAEGYSVFHGGKIDSQARLLYYAPELYNLLEAEAKKEGLPIPDRSAIDAEIKAQGLPP